MPGRAEIKFEWVFFPALAIPFILFGFFFFLFTGGTQDIVKQGWTHKEILDLDGGYIYINDGGFIDRFDVKEKVWEKPDRSIRDRYTGGWGWDISGDLVAYHQRIHEENWQLVVYRLADFTILTKIPGSYSDLKISPSGKHVALLKAGRMLGMGPHDNWGYFGYDSVLSIYSIDTGQKIKEYEKPVLADGLDWSADSNKLAFVKMRDVDRQFDPTREYEHSRSLLKLPKKFINIYDLNADLTTEICEGISPQWGPDGKQLFYSHYYVGDSTTEVFAYSFETGLSTSMFQDDVEDGMFALSPRGTSFLTKIVGAGMNKGRWGYLTVINRDNPKLRFIINSGFQRDYAWGE